jgi:hypothetical protein
MPDRYPGYDVLSKRNTPSWNEQTRRVVDHRIAVPREPRFLTENEFATLTAIADRIVPQPKSRPPVPVAALIDQKLLEDQGDGFRGKNMPRHREAWQRGLRALDAEATAAFGVAFRALDPARQDALLRFAETGDLHDEAWGGMPVNTFFKERLLRDIVFAYWSFPTAWNEIGWGGPASPRGYVRMGFGERDPWEAVAAATDPESARRKNRNVG